MLPLSNLLRTAMGTAPNRAYRTRAAVFIETPSSAVPTGTGMSRWEKPVRYLTSANVRRATRDEGGGVRLARASSGHDALFGDSLALCLVMPLDAIYVSG